MDISFTEREKVSGMVKQLMTDYGTEIEAAYISTDGEFKLAFNAKIKPQGNAKIITVEMSFDPARKIKDKITETIDPDQHQLPFKDKQDKASEPTSVSLQG